MMDILSKLDDDSLSEWAGTFDKIKDFILNHIDTQENMMHLLELISEYERLSRTRTRIYTARWLLRNNVSYMEINCEDN